MTAAVHDGFISALGATMALSLGLVALGIVLTEVLIRREEPVEEPVRPPNLADPFSGVGLRP